MYLYSGSVSVSVAMSIPRAFHATCLDAPSCVRKHLRTAAAGSFGVRLYDSIARRKCQQNATAATKLGRRGTNGFEPRICPAGTRLQAIKIGADVVAGQVKRPQHLS